MITRGAVFVVLLGLWAGTGWAELAWIEPNPCGSVTTAEGLSAQEEAKRYRERHECMMGLAEQPRVDHGDFVTTKTIPTFDNCGLWGDRQPDGMCQVFLHIEPGWRVMYQGRDIAVCLDRMEAAMRAIEPFAIPKTGMRVTTDREYPDAVKQWDAVKRDCWKQP